MAQLDKLLVKNSEWALRMKEEDPEFFRRLVSQQSPEYLWIGCSDSRVPANEIVGLLPGELFVHRNVANVVTHTDLNCLSVIQYAVETLEVKHIIVCGHYGCGGVHAAVANHEMGLIDNWLRHVQDVQQKHQRLLDDLRHPDRLVDKVCELNVVEQVLHVCKSTVVRQAWTRGQALTVHGWIYDIRDGLLKDLGFTVSCSQELEAAYHTAVTMTIETLTS
ncbi:carbonate dehydratase [Geomonas sp.]|uniref:carbonate dehydratase n=1 Tax=Geomonas sp. TaxID=2651584 RepID=UPI002B472B2E|nr:carbonate dehydratase [Geomonas sp.]HJV37135.1 carbonate dehydratase [Geomonas sp.]